MKDARRKRRICPTPPKNLNKMPRSPRPTTRDHRNLHRRTHHRSQLAIETRSHPVGIHRSQQNLSRPTLFRLASPITTRIPVAFRPPLTNTSASSTEAPSTRRASIATITACAPKLPPISPINSGRAIARRVDTHLIRPRIEHRRSILRTPNPTSNSKRHKQLRRRPLHGIEQRSAPLMRRRNIQQHNLIRSRRSMTMRQLRRIARIDDIHELHALHYAPTSNIQACNNPLRQHLSQPHRNSRRNRNLRIPHKQSEPANPYSRSPPHAPRTTPPATPASAPAHGTPSPHR